MVSTEFKQNVESGDLVTVQSALVDYLIIDRTFKDFDEAFNYAKSTLDIVQPYDKEPFSAEPWDSDYLNQQKVALMVNFSFERIEHIKQVINKVLPVTEEKQIAVSRLRTESTNNRENRTGRKVISEKPLQQQRETTTHRTNASVINRPSSPNNNTNTSTSRTGSRVVRETTTSSNRTDEKNKSNTDGLGTALLIGGVAVAVVGVATIEPIVIGAGVSVAGVGAGIKIKNRR